MHESQLDWWIDSTMGSEEPFDPSLESITAVKDCSKRKAVSCRFDDEEEENEYLLTK